MRTLILKIACVVVCGQVFDLAPAKAVTITLNYDSPVNSATNLVYGRNTQNLVVAPNWFQLIQPNWAQYSGMMALTGGSLTYVPDRNDTFTPNATGNSELYGLVFDLSSTSPSYSSANTPGSTDYGSVNWLVDATGTKLTITGVALTTAFNAGVSGTISTLEFSSPPPSVGGDEVNSLYSPAPEVLSFTLVPVPEPSTWVSLGFSGFVGVMAHFRHRRRHA